VRVDKSLSLILAMVAVVWSFIRTAVTPNSTLIGADCKTLLHDEEDEVTMYMSFAPSSVDKSFDQYGVADEDIFYYLSGIRELLSLMWNGHADGWTLTDAHLVRMSRLD
jgi:hypothetical protein